MYKCFNETSLDWFQLVGGELLSRQSILKQVNKIISLDLSFASIIFLSAMLYHYQHLYLPVSVM